MILKLRKNHYYQVEITTTFLSQPELIISAGYPLEQHKVETEDGFILTLHRIPGSKNAKPVFLQHGLLGSSADWVMTGKGKALGEKQKKN